MEKNRSSWETYIWNARLLVLFIRHLKRSISRQNPSSYAKEFVKNILPHTPSEMGKKIEAFRNKLCKNKQALLYEDLGAGTRSKTIGDHAKTSSRSHGMGELLRRMCAYYQPESCIELGTNLGISTLYQVSGLPKSSTLVSIEGIEILHNLAHQHLRHFEQNARLKLGRFEEILPLVLADFAEGIDYVFLDGNHRYAPTLEYFQTLLPAMKPGSIMIFDDIYWSQGMRKAWETIIQHPRVRLSIDLFFLGICFIDLPQEKEYQYHLHPKLF